MVPKMRKTRPTNPKPPRKYKRYRRRDGTFSKARAPTARTWHRAKQPEEWFEKQGERMWEKGVKTRCNILQILRDERLDATTIAKRLGYTPNAIRIQLRRMLEANQVVVFEILESPRHTKIWAAVA